MAQATPSYLCIAGPTASGKTAAALALAQEHAVEIISVDSALVYRGMDIGTAKPSAAELAQVPHHLIDIRDPLEPYNAQAFVHDAQALITAIQSRGKLPVLVGGTMLYFKALFDGLDAMPAANAEVRAALERQAAEMGWAAMHAELARVDPVTAARLAPADSQRIQRALEVYQVSGLPLSSFHATKKEASTALSTGAAALFSLEPMDRAWLHARIAQRFDAMLGQGFVDEVRTLRARGDLHAELPSMRCVGYRQVWQALDADVDLNTTAGLAQVRELGINATRQLAKRQITWLRSMSNRHIVACDHNDAQAQLLQQVRQLLDPRSP
jgi:tRNA dimethylallyltransferase